MKYETNGVSLHVEARGTGETTLVLLHYFGGSSQSWSAFTDHLSDRYRCVAPDLRGFGDSSAPQVFTVDAMADDVAALIRYLGLARYVLIGHSMGGKVALALAARNPVGLASLVLLAPSPPTPEPIPEESRRRLIASYGQREAILENARQITSQPLDEPALEQLVRDHRRTSPEAWLAWLEKGSYEDIAARVAQINVPTLVMVGEGDPVLPRAVQQREVVDRLPNARLIVVPETGHLLPLESPARVAELIRDFLL
ncbi:MAG: alpha/beta hydrolase [Ferruginibacter sp.]|nr:alpha/beta hydrolase [Cytophagales bacterium]